MNYIIREMSPQDWGQVRDIYTEGIETGNATFETEAPSWEAWDRDHVKSCRLVATDGDQVTGWAVLSPVSSRCVYTGVGEVSLYISLNHRGQGIGPLLLKEIIRCSELEGFWTLQSGIFPENMASLVMHTKCGFREVGLRKKMGKLNGVWRDVVLLERRSETVGID